MKKETNARYKRRYRRGESSIESERGERGKFQILRYGHGTRDSRSDGLHTNPSRVGISLCK
jgi:hypothetical protein